MVTYDRPDCISCFQDEDYLSMKHMENFDMDAFIAEDIDLSKFFTKSELNSMGYHQQLRYKNIAQNYEMMKIMGLYLFFILNYYFSSKT